MQGHARSKDIAEKIETRIARRPGEDVFLPAREFRDPGSEDQALRVLRTLVQENALYGWAMVSMVVRIEAFRLTRPLDGPYEKSPID